MNDLELRTFLVEQWGFSADSADRVLRAPTPWQRPVTITNEPRLVRAIAELRALLVAHPDDVRTTLKLADTLVRQGELAEAVQRYGEAAELYVTRGEFLKAVALHKQMLRVDPGNGKLFMREAELFAQLHLAKDAVVAALQALRTEAGGTSKRAFATIVAMLDDDGKRTLSLRLAPK